MTGNIKNQILIWFAFVLFGSCKEEKLLSNDFTCPKENLTPPIATFLGISQYGERISFFTKHESIPFYDNKYLYIESPDGQKYQPERLVIDPFGPEHEGIYYAYLDLGACKSEKTAIRLYQNNASPPCEYKKNIIDVAQLLTNKFLDSSKIGSRFDGNGYKLTYQTFQPSDPIVSISVSSGSTLKSGVYQTFPPSTSIAGVKEAEVSVFLSGIEYIAVEYQPVYLSDNGSFFDCTICSMQIYRRDQGPASKKYLLNLNMKINK